MRRGWKAYRKTEGDLQVMSHIMSIVRSRPAMLVLTSRFGRFDSCSLIEPVTSEMNCKWRYLSCRRMKLADSVRRRGRQIL